jgi:hypothetical protein
MNRIQHLEKYNFSLFRGKVERQAPSEPFDTIEHNAALLDERGRCDVGSERDTAIPALVPAKMLACWKLSPRKHGMPLSLLTRNRGFLHSLRHRKQGLVIYIIRKEKEHGGDTESAAEASRDPWIR